MIRKRKINKFNCVNIGNINLNMKSQYELNVNTSGYINEKSFDNIEYFDPPITENETLQNSFYKIQHGIKALNESRADIFLSFPVFDEDGNSLDIF